MRILLTGADGQLGRHLKPHLNELGELIETRREDCDLTQPDTLTALLASHEPDLVINTAAMTAVDDAEDQPELADQLNHRLPGQLAAWCESRSARLIHFSTDYVFDQPREVAWREEDQTAPQSVYGKTKWLGEQAIGRYAVGALIIRTAWVYSALGGNFLSAILNRVHQGQDLRVVDDQVGSPTWAGSLAEATGHLIRGDHVPSDHAELLHVVNRGAVSWYTFAQAATQAARAAGIIDHQPNIEAVDSSQWPQRAKRPAWSVLDPRKYETLSGRTMANWQEALVTCLSQWREWSC